MFPGVYGFTWDAGNIIFLGIFFTVAAVIAGTLGLAVKRAYKDHVMKKHEMIRWHQDFRDLPQRARTCRHVLTGELKQRYCPNGFDCRECDLHPQLLKNESVSGKVREKKRPAQAASASGFRVPLDRFYHRGHTWVRLESDGMATVGLDDFAMWLFGTPEKVELPPVGTHVYVNRPGWKMYRGESAVRVLSPVDGDVVEAGGPDEGWYLRVRPLGSAIDTSHLLHGDEVQAWIAGEMERLQASLRDVSLAPTLADGGEPVADLSVSLPGADWDGIWGEMFLEP